MRTYFIHALSLLTLSLGGCLQSVPPDQYLTQQFVQQAENSILQFNTAKGKQTAYYLAPLVNPSSPPKTLVIAYPGINSLALSWLDVIDSTACPNTGYLLIEYPGRGQSEGFMRPEELYVNSESALQELATHFNQTQLSGDIRLLSHSFGSGAALQFAARYQQIKEIVLVAPYDDLKHAVQQKSWLLSVIMPSQIDNRILIRQLLDQPAPPKISIIHGGRDQNLPLSMSQELQRIAPNQIRLIIFPEDGHTDILRLRRDVILREVNRE